MENKTFKTFDKVLVRDGGVWTPDIYSYYRTDINRHWCLGFGWLNEGQILPYEGNEELVGTNQELEEQVQVKYWEWIMTSNTCSNDPSAWYLEQCANIKENLIETKNCHYYHYFIKFSDFNPNDMEETRKHILCVKNGKIVRYKG